LRLRLRRWWKKSMRPYETYDDKMKLRAGNMAALHGHDGVILWFRRHFSLERYGGFKRIKRAHFLWSEVDG
jgi:hypothetical protein